MNADFGVKKKNGYGEEEEWLWRKKRRGHVIVFNIYCFFF